MSDGVINRVPFGVRNEEFEKVGAGSADRYAGEDRLIASVARAARLVLMARERKEVDEQRERAEALLRDRVGQLFREFTGDAEAITNATGFAIHGQVMSYNSLHISVRNPDYVPPARTVTHHPNGGTSIRYDWSQAYGTEFRDVTAREVLENPSLGIELVVRNEFHL